MHWKGHRPLVIPKHCYTVMRTKGYINLLSSDFQLWQHYKAEKLHCSDPVDAFLMDGECVSVWLNKTLNATVARVKQALGSDFSVVHSQIICEEIGRINCLIYVSKTLEPQAVG